MWIALLIATCLLIRQTNEYTYDDILTVIQPFLLMAMQWLFSCKNVDDLTFDILSLLLHSVTEYVRLCWVQFSA